MKKTALLIALVLMGYAGMGQDDVNIQMIFVKGASFFMGCDDHKFLDAEYDNEKPLHRVSVGSYYIGKYEVTLGQWRRIMGVKPHPYTGIDYGNKNCDDCPVVKVSWEDVQEFIKRLNAKTGKHYRLPTETEWEFAARGGKYSKAYKYSGSNKITDVAWYGKEKGTTHPVGQKDPNELSIFDMTGNAAEWCEDWYGEDYYKKSIDEVNPKGPDKGNMRILRGGSYFDDDVVCRNVYRSRVKPDTRQWNIGFRLAMDYD
ncbi:MAG: Sulphatase-modifying factor protein [Flavipsychrobacter sp.]|jgi:formylglycine-generating enzyme required for sulfatase activity|nr:Sulphatase-modifying factor protein [Flavipsychrobacter sp.]